MSQVTSFFSFFFIYSVLQDVHVGHIPAEAEDSSKQTDSTEWRQDAHSVQQKIRSPVKHTISPRKKATQDSRPRAKPTGWTCGECLQWFPERDSYVSHMKTSHGKVRPHYLPKLKSVYMFIQTLMTELIWKKALPLVCLVSSHFSLCIYLFLFFQQSVKKYPCRHCEQSFNSTISLRRHIRNNHDGKKKVYTCW